MSSSTRRCRSATPMSSAIASRPRCARPSPRPRSSCTSTAGTIASCARPRPEAMGRQPAFVVADQSEVIAFLEARLSPVKRIDTHGAVVFLARERAYKLKRAVKFPYMDFSTVDRRAAMCAAEIGINRQLAPQIYLGTAPVRRGSDGKLALGGGGGAAAAGGDLRGGLHPPG